MPIDGRDIVRAGEPPAHGAAAPRDHAPVQTTLAWAIVVVPLAIVAWLTYLTGTWMGGGVLGGLLSVVVTLGMVIGAWALNRNRRAK